jgi:hypothetical protein
MRARIVITVLLLYIAVMPVAVHAGQATAVPQVGVLLPVQRADYDEAKDPLKVAFIFELIVNARTATSLGLSIPNSILISANEMSGA